MTVDEMLTRIGARELTDWEAYEQAFGPLGNIYAEDKLAGIHELLQAVLIGLGATDGNTVERQPRPNEIFQAAQLRLERESEQEELSPQDQMARFNEMMDAM